MSVTLLAQKGQMGENTYYITTMKANTLIKTVGFASEMEKWPDMSVDERMQREIKGDRVVSEIVPYIVNDPECFWFSYSGHLFGLGGSRVSGHSGSVHNKISCI